MKANKLLISILTLISLTHANDNLEISSKLLEEVSKGSKVLKELTEAIPGNIVAYQHTIKNPTSSIAKEIVFSDIIPKHTTYVPNSATCSGECLIEYSVDGEVFEKASELFVYTNSLSLANPKKYKHIRWTFSELKPNSKKVILFKTKID
jgi:uncharacterized repeat protein (TIGR01451 family)